MCHHMCDPLSRQRHHGNILQPIFHLLRRLRSHARISKSVDACFLHECRRPVAKLYSQSADVCGTSKLISLHGDRPCVPERRNHRCLGIVVETHHPQSNINPHPDPQSSCASWEVHCQQLTPPARGGTCCNHSSLRFVT